MVVVDVDVVVVMVVCGRPAVYGVVYCGGCCLRLQCICGASAVRRRIVVFVEVVVVCVCVCVYVCVCGTPAVPLRCARGTFAVQL